MRSKTLRLGILISGSGRTLQNLIDQIEHGKLPAEINVVISSKPGAYGLARAKKHGLPAAVIDYKKERSFSKLITALLDEHRVDLVVMAGFIHYYRIPPKYHRKVINIHPALLPKFGGKGFYGEKVHQAVIEAGEKESGCTVHYADNEYDHGAIILQRRVPVLPSDTPETLAERVFQEECIAYPEAIRKIAGSLT